MNSGINNKFNKSIILIIITIIFIILVLKIFSYARLIIPQLLNDYSSEYNRKPVTLSEDSEVIKVLKKAEGLNGQELYELASEMNKREKYKEAYHLYRIMSEKDSDKTLAYAEMANSYARVLNFEKAIEIAEEALTMIDELTPLEQQYFAYYTAATIYYYREFDWGFVDSDRTIELFEKALSIQVNNPEYKEYCEVRNLQIYAFLVDMYSYSPKIYNPESAIYYLERLYELSPGSMGLKLDMALLYLKIEDLNSSEVLIQEYKKSIRNYMDLLTVECLYKIESGKYKEAKKILNQFKNVLIDDTYKKNYYFLSISYYEAIGEIDRAKEYARKFLSMNEYNVFIDYTVLLEQRLGLNFDDIREKIKKQNEEYNKISLELKHIISN